MSPTSSQPARRALLTERDVATLFGVTTRTVQTWARTGVVEAVRVGGVTRYRPDDIERLIAPTNDERLAGNEALDTTSDAGTVRDGANPTA